MTPWRRRAKRFAFLMNWIRLAKNTKTHIASIACRMNCTLIHYISVMTTAVAESGEDPVTNSLPEVLSLLRSVLETEFPGFIPGEMVVRSVDGRKIQLPLLCLRRRPRQFSPTEEMILKALGAGEWRTAQQIAMAVAMAKSSTFMAILGNMAEAGVIESSTRSGYRLPCNAESVLQKD